MDKLFHDGSMAVGSRTLLAFEMLAATCRHIYKWCMVVAPAMKITMVRSIAAIEASGVSINSGQAECPRQPVALLHEAMLLYHCGEA